MLSGSILGPIFLLLPPYKCQLFDATCIRFSSLCLFPWRSRSGRTFLSMFEHKYRPAFSLWALPHCWWWLHARLRTKHTTQSGDIKSVETASRYNTQSLREWIRLANGITRLAHTFSHSGEIYFITEQDRALYGSNGTNRNPLRVPFGR